jgi:hypothetical protein
MACSVVLAGGVLAAGQEISGSSSPVRCATRDVHLCLLALLARDI